MSGELATYPEIAKNGKARVAASPVVRSSESTRSNVSRIVLGSVIALYLALCCQLLFAELAATGTLTYTLDDTYISMAIAKNFALHGVWNINPTHFISATSCPGYLLLLAAAYRITGPTVWWPLVFSLGFGLLAVVVAWRLLRGTPTVLQAAALAAIVFFTPLHVLGVLGMEHTLHIVLVLAFLDLASKALADRCDLSWAALLLTSSMVMIRYESLFVVAIAGLLFLEQRQIRAALALGIAAITPVALYGFISVRHGGYWLPNSVAQKGASARNLTQIPGELVDRFLACLQHAPYMGALIAMMVALLAFPALSAAKRARVLLDLVLGATVLHLMLADVDWGYRYESYLIAAAIAAIAIAASQVPFANAAQMKLARNRWPALALAVSGAVAFWMLSSRFVAAERTVPERSEAVYSQQFQMARFLSRYETGAVVAANDVGAINYFADIHCVDLVGLADNEVFWLKRKGLYNTPNLAKLAAERGVQIAVVYDSWFSVLPLSKFSGPPLPRSWIRVGRWRTPYGQFLGSSIVSFYAVNPDEAAKLQHNLKLFESSLPSSVEVDDRYIVSPLPEFTWHSTPRMLVR